jgi:hypothetical protein
MLPHQHGGICNNLLWQKQMLEKLQTKKDQITPSTSDPGEMNYTGAADPDLDPQTEAAQDEIEMRFLDQLFSGHNPEDVAEEEESDIVDTEADIHDTDAGTAGFTDYMNDRPVPIRI